MGIQMNAHCVELLPFYECFLQWKSWLVLQKLVLKTQILTLKMTLQEKESEWNSENVFCCLRG